MAHISRSENPLLVRVGMAIWQWFANDLRLHEATKSRFSSLHDCFIRELKPGARPIDQAVNVLVSPCDAVIGEFGSVEGLQAIQAKGFPYSLEELLGDAKDVALYAQGSFLTLRLKSSMYHRFHAPCAGRVDQVRYISGDTWNVNPVALKVIEKLFCRNERAVIRFVPEAGEGRCESEAITIVAVAAILVACIRLHGLAEPLHLRYQGPNLFKCALDYRKGEEMGWFEHGSTLVLLLPGGYQFHPGMRAGEIIRAGQAIMCQPTEKNDI